MERDEILKMAQKESEHYDEREVFIQMKGYNYGMVASAIEMCIRDSVFVCSK